MKTTDDKNIKYDESRTALKSQFSTLQQRLLAEILEETVNLPLQGRLKLAANEAAGLAWMTAYPLLVYPSLLVEKAQSARLQDQLGQRIAARSSVLLEPCEV